MDMAIIINILSSKKKLPLEKIFTKYQHKETKE